MLCPNLDIGLWRIALANTLLDYGYANIPHYLEVWAPMPSW